MALSFTQHSTGGGWAGGGSAPNCSDQQRTAVLALYENLKTCIAGSSCLGQAMRDRIDSSPVEIDCGTNCGGAALSRSGSKITVCDLRANNANLYFARAIVRAAGLSGLDSFVVGATCFPGGVANPIGDPDWNTMKDGTSNQNNILWFGYFVVWNSETGQVFRRDGNNAGPLCFQSNDWRHVYPRGGWV